MGFQSSIWFITQGVIVTLKYSLISVFFGLIAGTVLAIMKVSQNMTLKLFANAYTSVFRGTPLIIQLSIIYFAPNMIGIHFDVFIAGIIGFSLNSGAYVSEVIRSGINSVDQGQFEAARALGIPKLLMMKDIILPQAIKNIFPSLVNELINLIKESAIISTIGGMDLFKRAQIISIETYDYFTPMLIAAAAYYLMILTISSTAKIIERKL